MPSSYGERRRGSVCSSVVGTHVEITVTDTGIGINPEFLPHVFDRFRQADGSAARTVKGLGLGLSIVKHLVELHGGAVQASSSGVGTGATFRIRLPLALPHAATGTRSSAVDFAYADLSASPCWWRHRPMHAS